MLPGRIRTRSFALTEKIARHVLFNIPTDPSVLIAVGKVAIRHAHLEQVVRLARRSVTNETVEEALQFTNTSFSDVVKKLRKAAGSAAAEKTPSVRFLALIEAAVAASDERNRLMHGLWGEELDGDFVFSTRGQTFNAPPTAATIETLAVKIEQLVRDIIDERFLNVLSNQISD